jgi:hypothetical protein
MPSWPAGDLARPDHRNRRRRTTKPKIGKLLVRIAPLLLVLALAALALAPPALADTPSAPTLNGVIDALRVWLVGILAGLATLFLTIGGIRYLAAGGDPAEVERAKTALKSAAIGFALAALAPLIVSILQSVVGG